ncbi:RNA pyrophosphohydrolase [Devosia enhydra]|nr:RNA pyrophosphohydrolase [Devosia enhydra]
MSMPKTPPDRQSLPYRDCVGIALFNAEGQVFIGRRQGIVVPEGAEETQRPWQMPQGGMDKGETAREAALRELWEETSVRSVRFIAELPDWIYYDLPDADLGIALKGKYRGQRQRWFAFRLTGDDSEIDVLAPGGGEFPAEFDAWRWEDLSSLPDLIVPFKREAYEKIVSGFAGLPELVRQGA